MGGNVESVRLDAMRTTKCTHLVQFPEQKWHVLCVTHTHATLIRITITTMSTFTRVMFSGWPIRDYHLRAYGFPPPGQSSAYGILHTHLKQTQLHMVLIFCNRGFPRTQQPQTKLCLRRTVDIHFVPALL